MVGQPAGQGDGLTVGEHVDGPVGVDVNQDRAVGVPLAEGEVVHAQHPGGGPVRVGQGADHPQQRVPPGRHAQQTGQAGPGTARQRQGDPGQGGALPLGAVGIRPGQPRYLFGEGLPGAFRSPHRKRRTVNTSTTARPAVGK
jgi:hypothetical protein